GSVGIAHAEVDDVLAAPARRHLELRGDVEDVGREALDARELHGIGGEGHANLLSVCARNRPSDVEAVEAIIVTDQWTYRNAQSHRALSLPALSLPFLSLPFQRPMKFHLNAGAGNVFTGYGDDYVRLGVVV